MGKGGTGVYVTEKEETRGDCDGLWVLIEAPLVSRDYERQKILHAGTGTH